MLYLLLAVGTGGRSVADRDPTGRPFFGYRLGPRGSPTIFAPFLTVAAGLFASGAERAKSYNFVERGGSAVRIVSRTRVQGSAVCFGWWSSATPATPGRADHRQDAGPDGLGQVGPGGSDFGQIGGLVSDNARQMRSNRGRGKPQVFF